jgi:(E)-4-hydroxy-3-methylbut-2-enyl-diphosphate synthase
VYVDGKLAVTLKGDNIVPEFLKILDDYVERTYGATSGAGSNVTAGV